MARARISMLFPLFCCSTGAVATGLASPKTTPPPPRVAARIAEAPWRRAYEPAGEWDRVECAVAGSSSLPPELSGVLYRNGAGRIRVGEALYSHWFDGDGFVTRLALSSSSSSDSGVKAVSSGRYVRTARFLAQEGTTDQMVMRGAWTPRGDGGLLANAGRLPTNPANTNVARLPPDGKLYALCEGGRPVELDPRTLETNGGEYDAQGALKYVSTGPKRW
ncbi:retinal pigment epithelial membrane protein-domain-containing protein [Pavlovales sp. CCMP2436]|nr:retinal pigment epithelial membrane protein-domain-containing protein [Pavlovales sp. CCMP2436]